MSSELGGTAWSNDEASRTRPSSFHVRPNHPSSNLNSKKKKREKTNISSLESESSITAAPLKNPYSFTSSKLDKLDKFYYEIFFGLFNVSRNDINSRISKFVDLEIQKRQDSAILHTISNRKHIRTFLIEAILKKLNEK